MSRDERTENAKKINRFLAKVILVFLIFIPVLFVLLQIEKSTIPLPVLLGICFVFMFGSLFPLFANRIFYDEGLIANLILFCMAGMFLLIAINPFVELSGIYILLPLLSLLYCDEKLSLRMCLTGYFIMIFACFFRNSCLDKSISLVYSNDNIYITILKFSLEYLLFAVVICKASSYFDSNFSWRGNGASVEKDGKQNRYEVAPGSDSTVKNSTVKNRGEGREEKPQDTGYDTQSFFHDIDKDLNSLIKGKEKTMQVQLDEQLPVRLQGDKKKLRQALTGICSDLLMYHSKAAVTMEVSFDDGICAKRGQNITLVVRIKGDSNIAAETANKTALGYFLGKNIVEELHGGFEDLSSRHEAFFKITLLQRVADEKTIEQRMEQQNIEIMKLKQQALKKKENRMFKQQVKALVVDDSREVCKLVSAILSGVGVESESAYSGAEALELLESKDFQIVFLDYMMPEKSGAETVRELRFLPDSYYKKVPVVLMTVNTKEDVREEAIENGFNDCIRKPISGDELRECLQKWIKEEIPVTYEEYRKQQEKDYSREHE